MHALQVALMAASTIQGKRASLNLNEEELGPHETYELNQEVDGEETPATPVKTPKRLA